MTTIAILNQKGGCGKTTLATNITVELARKGRSVLLVDADEQKSALDWCTQRVQNEVETNMVTAIGMPTNTIHRQLSNFTQFDDIVIDGPAKIAGVATSAIRAADVVLIPVQPSPFDIWATDLIRQTIEDEVDPIAAAFVINRRVPGTRLGREVRGALESTEFPVFDASIAQRTLFAQAAAAGLAACELEPNGIASEEIVAVLTEAAHPSFVPTTV